ncbi:hypothetical protein D9M71_801040 [compost metagenome]
MNSPAQHQIHHSDAPRHFNRNFGTNLSLWDWMFGTLYVTTSKPEDIRFGTGEQGHQRYLTVYSLIVTPFIETGRKLLAKRQRKKGLDGRSSAHHPVAGETPQRPGGRRGVWLIARSGRS